jgi:hypothetical protein
LGIPVGILPMKSAICFLKEKSTENRFQNNQSRKRKGYILRKGIRWKMIELDILFGIRF